MQLNATTTLCKTQHFLPHWGSKLIRVASPIEQRALICASAVLQLQGDREVIGYAGGPHESNEAAPWLVGFCMCST